MYVPYTHTHTHTLSLSLYLSIFPSPSPPSPLRALSSLAHWSPIFGETEYLPGLVFPFVKLFQNNQLVTFELLATFLSK